MLLETMDIEIENPTLIWEDNSACIDVTCNESACKRTKHIDVRHHFIREYYKAGVIDIKHMSTENQPADILTKTLGPSLFRFLRDIIVSDKILLSQ